MMIQRSAYEKDMAAQIEELSGRIDALKEKADRSQISDFYGRLDKAWERFHEVEEAREAEEGVWDRLRETLDNTYRELRDSVERASAEL